MASFIACVPCFLAWKNVINVYSNPKAEKLITICWSFNKWIILDVHSPICMMSGDDLNKRNNVSAALCFTASIVSLESKNK